MPIAAAFDRGFSIHGGATRSAKRRIASSFTTCDEVGHEDALVPRAHAHRQLVAEIARGGLAHAGHAQVLAQQRRRLDVEVVERDDAIERRGCARCG